MKNQKTVITNKKKRILNSYINSFLEHSLVHFYGNKPKEIEIPESSYFKKYLKDRVAFLNEIEFNCYIVTVNGVWYSVIFKYKDYILESKTGLFKFPEMPKEFIELKFKNPQ